jgi:hypothetical protein
MRHVRVKGSKRSTRKKKGAASEPPEPETTYDDNDEVDVDWTDGKVYPCTFLEYVRGAKYQVHFDDGHRGRVARSAITSTEDTAVKRGVVALAPIGSPPKPKGLWDGLEVAEGERRRRPRHNYLMLAKKGQGPDEPAD